ncbi:hypothetical protein BGZ59_010823 [Podila verticillata]|nr:hypothetical protein BGZ59_010823 [Podila verticillata]
MSALANLDPSRLALRNYDPKADTSLIAIRVRYVSKDLWIRIDIPRNIPVHQARDLILKKCQLTLAPPSAPSSLAETSLQDDDTTPTELNYQAMNHLAPSLDAIFSGTIDVTKSQRTPEDKPLASPDPNKTPTNKTQKANGDIKTSHSDSSISKSLASQSSGSDKETPRSPTSIDDERRLNAEKLVERLAMFSDCLNGFGEEANVNYAKSIVTVPSGHVKDPPSKGTSSLKRLLSHSSTSHDETTPNNPSDKRLGHWLDDSRLISSYNLEPYDLLELQLRNHYIQLPPPGGHLNYSDHYAEGVLFKLSKKSKPVSMLTSNGKDSTGVWKERPTLISNAMVAFSNLNGSHTQQGGNDYHRSLSHGGLADRNDAPLQHHSLVGKEDSRRRAITEPHLNIPQSRNKHAAKGSLTGMDSQLRSMDVSNVSEAPFRLDSPPGRKRRPVLGTEYLDNASQVLLASSSARSSTAPLYSGYIWLYVPPTSKDTGTKDHHASESGRYVKCFAAINDQGHFQWVEVKKQTDLETEQESKSEAGAGPIAPSRSSYGIQLKPKKDTNQRLPPLPSSDSSVRDGGSPVSPNAEVVQATMAHKLRLFFFCIRISQEALAQVMLEMASESPTSRSQNKTPPSSSKTRHRLSSSISALGSSALPPLPLKSQSLSGSVSKGMSKNSTWPAMAPLQQIHHDRSHEGYGALLFPEKPLTTSPGSQSRPVSHRRSSTSLKSSKDDGAMSPSSSVDMGSSSDVVVRAQFLQKAAALTRQLSISSSGDKQDHSTLSPPSSSPSSSKARLSLGETVSAKKADIPDSALAYESVIHDRASQGLGRLDTHRNEDNELLSKCPFLETSEDVGRGQKITLKGYAETEEGWKILQSALERFIDPVQDQLSALPPEDTLIPSYTLLTSPETRLSEKAEMYLSAKATLLEEANLHASMAAAAVATSVSESLEVRSPTPDQVTVSSAPYGPTAPKGTSVLHRLMNLSGGGDRDKSKGSTPTSPMPEQYNRQALFVDNNVPGSPLTPTGTGMSIKRGVSPGGPLSQSVGAATGLLRPRPRLNQQRSADELTKMSGYYAQSDFKNGGIGLGMYSTSTAIGDSGSSNGQPPHHRLRPRGKYRPQDEQDYSKLDEGHHHHHHHPSHHYFVSTNNNGPVPRSMSLTAATSSHHVNTMVMLAGESDKFPKRASRSSMYSLQSPMITHGHGGRDDDEGDFKGGIVSGIMDLDNVMSNDNHLNHPSDQDHGSRNTSPSSSSPSPSSSSGKQSSLAKDNQDKFSPLMVSSPRMTGRGIGGGDHEVLQHPFDSHSRHEDDGEVSKMAQGRDSNQNGRSSHNHHHHHRHHHHHLSMDKDKSKKPHTVLGAGKAAVSGVFGKIRKSVG